MSSIARFSRAAIREFNLNLSGLTVLTEAATGAFAATAVLAAGSGAKVFAIAKSSRHGSMSAASRQTMVAARNLRDSSRITVVSSIRQVPLSTVDIVTNSGHVRPISKSWIRQLSKQAVVSLMVEPWEVRPKDIDVPALRKAGIAMAGVNERGQKVNVFSYLTPLLRSYLQRNEKVFLRTSREFSSYLLQGIRVAGARRTQQIKNANVFVLAIGHQGRLSTRDLRALPSGARIIQIWGDFEGKRDSRWKWIPASPPQKGHMGIRLDDLGPEPAIRLAAAGLKVGELLARARQRGLTPTQCTRFAVRSGFALPMGR